MSGNTVPVSPLSPSPPSPVTPAPQSEQMIELLRQMNSELRALREKVATLESSSRAVGSGVLAGGPPGIFTVAGVPLAPSPLGSQHLSLTSPVLNEEGFVTPVRALPFLSQRPPVLPLIPPLPVSGTNVAVPSSSVASPSGANSPSSTVQIGLAGLQGQGGAEEDKAAQGESSTKSKKEEPWMQERVL